MTSICAGGWSVDASAGPAGATLQALEQARQKMGLPDTEDTGVRPPSADDDGEERSATGRIAARCWALLLVRIYECLSLVCTRCGARRPKPGPTQTDRSACSETGLRG